MGIQQAMYSGVSGIAAEGQALGVVGDNISNVDTVGFKEQRSVFEDVLGRSITESNAGPGAGVRFVGADQLFTQGQLNNTGVSTDMALNGDGFFVVNGSTGGMPGTYYTRNGQFKLDSTSTFVNQDGMHLQGYMARPDGTFSASVTDLKLASPALPPHATTTLKVSANLNSNATVPTLPWDPQNPSQTSNFSTTISVYDSLGNAHQLNVYFRETASNTYDYHVLANSSEITGGTGTYTEIGTGTLAFGTDGSLTSNTVSTPIAANFVGATAAQAITVNFGTGTGAGGTGLDGVTQFAAPNNVTTQSQDGYAAGQLAGVSVNQDGVLLGTYTNGQKLAIGQLAVAKFQSNEGLARAGANLWSQTTGSGLAAVGVAGSGGRGAVTGGALEGSNVDLAQQMVEMITHQRAFQSNSKTIQTADQMLQEITQLKQ